MGFSFSLIFAITVLGSVVFGAEAKLRKEPILRFPTSVDSNSPAVWLDNNLLIFNSADGQPQKNEGYNVYSLNNVGPIVFSNTLPGRRWLEAIIADDDGTLYGWYHYEPAVVCEGVEKTAPQIGAARSKDSGMTWQDLGIIIMADPRAVDCNSVNKYFLGGVGDFSVILDHNKMYLYFYFTAYDGELHEQGVVAARMLWADRDNPVPEEANCFNDDKHPQALRRWHRGLWVEPGLCGKHSPIFTARGSWLTPEADSVWGPSIHWNTYLEKYVMLLNRAQGSEFLNEGIYISYSDSLESPWLYPWQYPQKLEDSGKDWYPQVMGLEHGIGTDKVAGKEARFFLSGVSKHTIVFEK